MERLFLEKDSRGRPLFGLDAARAGLTQADARAMNPLQLAYLGDTLHDLYVRSLLLRHRASVGAMHKRAVRMVSAGAQAAMLEAIAPQLTEEEADVARRGRNAQAKHAPPRHQDAADYARATGLEALWGYLYLCERTDRLLALMASAVEQTEALWQEPH